MRPKNSSLLDSYYINDSEMVQEELERVAGIMDAKYEPANIDKVVQECSHLKDSEKQELHNLLTKYKSLFDGTLGTWKGPPHTIQLKQGAQPYHAKPYAIPKAYEKTLKYELKRLCELGVLKMHL